MCDRMTWRSALLAQMAKNRDSWSNIKQITLTEEELDINFNSGFGSAEGKPFTCWTKQYVYFPTEYDGAEGVSSVSRNPDGKPTRHIS